MISMFVTVMFSLPLVEALCVSAGLGAYPSNSRPKCGRGPTDFTKLQEV